MKTDNSIIGVPAPKSTRNPSLYNPGFTDPSLPKCYWHPDYKPAEPLIHYPGDNSESFRPAVWSKKIEDDIPYSPLPCSPFSNGQYPAFRKTSDNLFKFSAVGAEAAKAAGLVIYKTSDTDSSGEFVSFALSRILRLKKSVRNACSGISDELEALGVSKKYRSWFVTLTYDNDHDWNPYQITALIKILRSWCKRQGIKFRFVWVAEIQENRRRKNQDHHCVHYHLVIWLPRHVTLPKFDKKGWWLHGMTKVEIARNPIGYLLKYASKGTEYPFPKGCRISGCGGLTEDGRLKKAFWALPKYVREHFNDYLARVRRCVGGGFLSKLTGEFLPSAWIVELKGIITVRPKPIEDFSLCM